MSTELFPEVDSGQFVLRFRAPPGTEYDLTRQCALKILDIIDEESHGNLETSIGYVGLNSTNTATNNILLFMRATDDGELRVRLRPDSGGVSLADLRESLLQSSCRRRLSRGCKGRYQAQRRLFLGRRGGSLGRSRWPSASSRATSSAR